MKISNQTRIKISGWDQHFEADRSRQWKKLSWVPIPNKQGLGYKKIMADKRGAEIFGCWIAIVEQGSLCEIRGDLSKYTISDLSINTLINRDVLINAIEFISNNTNWLDVIVDYNLDKNVNNLDVCVSDPPVVSSLLCNVMLSSSCNSSEQKKRIKKEFIPPTLEEVKEFFKQNGYSEELAERFFNGYNTANWLDSNDKSVKNWKQKAHHVWFKPEHKTNNINNNTSVIKKGFDKEQWLKDHNQ